MKMGFPTDKLKSLKIPNPLPAIEQQVDGWSNLQKTLLYLLTFVLLVGGFYLYRYQPNVRRVRRLRSSIAGLDQRLRTLKKIARELEPFRKQVEAARSDLDHLLTLLPDQKEIPDLLEKVSHVGAQEGLENVLFQPRGERKHDFYATIPIRLDVVGTYHRLGTFLDKLSRLNRIIQVDSVAMSRQEDAVLKINCGLRTFRFLEESERVKKGKAKKGKKGR